MNKTTKSAGAATVALLLLIAAFSSQILKGLYGLEYLAYSDLLVGFSGLYVLVFIGTILRFIIRTVEKNQAIFWSYIITAVLSLLAAGPLVRQFDLAGVLIGLVALQVISLSIFIYTLRSEIACLYK